MSSGTSLDGLGSRSIRLAGVDKGTWESAIADPKVSEIRKTLHTIKRRMNDSFGRSMFCMAPE